MGSFGIPGIKMLKFFVHFFIINSADLLINGIYALLASLTLFDSVNGNVNLHYNVIRGHKCFHNCFTIMFQIHPFVRNLAISIRRVVYLFTWYNVVYITH